MRLMILFNLQPYFLQKVLIKEDSPILQATSIAKISDTIMTENEANIKRCDCPDKSNHDENCDLMVILRISKVPCKEYSTWEQFQNSGPWDK